MEPITYPLTEMYLTTDTVRDVVRSDAGDYYIDLSYCRIWIGPEAPTIAPGDTVRITIQKEQLRVSQI